MFKTKFENGTQVVSNVSAQGMSMGERFTVASSHVRQTPFGAFVTYTLVSTNDGRTVTVGNGHLLLNAV